MKLYSNVLRLLLQIEVYKKGEKNREISSRRRAATDLRTYIWCLGGVSSTIVSTRDTRDRPAPVTELTAAQQSTVVVLVPARRSAAPFINSVTSPAHSRSKNQYLAFARAPGPAAATQCCGIMWWSAQNNNPETFPSFIYVIR